MGVGLARFAVDNLRDARHIGPKFVLRHLNARVRRSLTRTKLKGVGPIAIRNDTSDADVFRQIFSTHQYELMRYPQYPEIRSFLDSILAEGETPLIIDLGANVGASALWFTSRFPECRIVAVEPDLSNAAVCRENIAPFDNIELITAAIGGSAGFADLVDERGKWGVATTRSAAGSVRVCTVDDILNSRPGCRLFLVKVDIEGFESDLFAANTDWVATAKVIIIEPHDWLLPHAASSRSFQRVMGELDFDLLLSGENLIYIRRHDPDRQSTSYVTAGLRKARASMPGPT